MNNIKALNDIKLFIPVIATFIATTSFAQTTTEAEIKKLSNDNFRLEMKNDADSMANILDDAFIGVSSSGIKRNKTEYLAKIKNTATIHNSMVFCTVLIATSNVVLVSTAHFCRS